MDDDIEKLLGLLAAAIAGTYVVTVKPKDTVPPEPEPPEIPPEETPPPDPVPTPAPIPPADTPEPIPNGTLAAGQSWRMGVSFDLLMERRLSKRNSPESAARELSRIILQREPYPSWVEFAYGEIGLEFVTPRRGEWMQAFLKEWIRLNENMDVWTEVSIANFSYSLDNPQLRNNHRDLLAYIGPHHRVSFKLMAEFWLRFNTVLREPSYDSWKSNMTRLETVYADHGYHLGISGSVKRMFRNDVADTHGKRADEDPLVYPRNRFIIMDNNPDNVYNLFKGTTRKPGYITWLTNQWASHCNDPVWRDHTSVCGYLTPGNFDAMCRGMRDGFAVNPIQHEALLFGTTALHYADIVDITFASDLSRSELEAVKAQGGNARRTLNNLAKLYGGLQNAYAP